MLTRTQSSNETKLSIKKSSIPTIRHNGQCFVGTTVPTIYVTITTITPLEIQLRSKRTITTAPRSRLRSNGQYLSNTIGTTTFTTRNINTTPSINHRTITTIVQFLVQVLFSLTGVIRFIRLTSSDRRTLKRSLTPITICFTELIKKSAPNTGKSIPTLPRIGLTKITSPIKMSMKQTEQIQCSVDTKGATNLP